MMWTNQIKTQKVSMSEWSESQRARMNRWKSGYYSASSHTDNSLISSLLHVRQEQEAMAREQEEQKAAADDSQSRLKPKINTDVASKQQQKQQQEDEEPKSPTAPAGFLGVVPPSMTGEESPVSPSKHEAMEEKKLVEESNQGQEEQQIKKEEESSQPYQVEPAPNRPQLPESKSSSSVKFPSPEAAEVDTLAPLPESTTAEESQVSEAPASIQEQNQDTSLTSDDKGSSSPRSNSIRKRIASLGSMMGSRRTPSTSSIPSTSNHQVESSEASTIQPGAAREREISQAGSETPSVSGEVGNGKKKKVSVQGDILGFKLSFGLVSNGASLWLTFFPFFPCSFSLSNRTRTKRRKVTETRRIVN